MALNYSQILQGGGMGVGARAIDTARSLQGLRDQRFNAQQAQNQVEAQSLAQTQDTENRSKAAELLTNGTPDQIAEFGIQNPLIMKDVISAAEFKDEQAVGSRLVYAQTVLSGSGSPRVALMDRIREVELSGGNASGLKQTLQGSDADIIKAAEKDFAVMNPKGYESYRKATGRGDTKLTPKQKDFAKYQELKKTDPAAAEVFGAGAGFVKDDQKRVFQIIDGVKVFADGTEKPLGGNDKIKTPSMKRSISKNQALNVLGKAKEYQTKAAGFANRLRGSIDGMEALVKGVNGTAINPARAALINRALGDGSVANMALNSEEQQYMVHAKDALFAVLRPETGAAITDSEMKQYSQIYLPQPGDTEATTKLKQNKLENQFKSLRYKAPRVYDATQALDKIENPSVEEQTVNAAITQDEYNALPSGTEYEINGVKYIKGQ